MLSFLLLHVFSFFLLLVVVLVSVVVVVSFSSNCSRIDSIYIIRNFNISIIWMSQAKTNPRIFFILENLFEYFFTLLRKIAAEFIKKRFICFSIRRVKANNARHIFSKWFCYGCQLLCKNPQRNILMSATKRK